MSSAAAFGDGGTAANDEENLFVGSSNDKVRTQTNGGKNFILWYCYLFSFQGSPGKEKKKVVSNPLFGDDDDDLDWLS